jgi:hypothetical protein
MSLGSQTQVVDGQRFTMPSVFQFAPNQYGPQTTGVPQVSPTMPPFIGAANGAGSSLGVQEGVNGYGTAGNNAMMTAIAAENPHSLKVSPVWWAVAALVGGLLMLRATAWRKTTLEGASESAHVEGAREHASEDV